MDLILIIIILVLLFGGGFGYRRWGIWWRHRYRRYSADRTHRLFVVRTRGIVIFPNYLGCAPESQLRADSPLEGNGFELLAPRHESSGFLTHSGRSLSP